MANQEKVIRSISGMLNSYLFDHVVAGGYPQALANELNPKDVDFCIYGFHPGDEAEQRFVSCLMRDLKELMSHPEACQDVVGDSITNVVPFGIFCNSNRGDGYYGTVKQVVGVLKLTFANSLPVDLIFREDRHPSGGKDMYARFSKGSPCNSVRHVLNDFDVDMSQYILDMDTLKPVYMGAALGKVHIVNVNNITKTRCIKLISKARSLGWNYGELVHLMGLLEIKEIEDREAKDVIFNA